MCVWINYSSVVENSDSHIHSHIYQGTNEGFIFTVLVSTTFPSGATSHSEWQPWQTWEQQNIKCRNIQTRQTFLASLYKEPQNKTGTIRNGWVTQTEFFLRGPADAVVLEKLLQEFFLIEELQTLHSTIKWKRFYISLIMRPNLLKRIP